ncbi:MAG TPA: tRNA adenosine(34) deaminase TadA [Gammaproteobacteria bacterium]|nr:tRNA adenosine(34) deaminase TadA [Gammaproteobacteria bacterium]
MTAAYPDKAALVFTEADQRWMLRALSLAEEARAAGEVPVGAVVVEDELEIGAGFNRPIGAADPSAHAEIVALRAAAEARDNYRLPGTTLYVTLEPCPMCAGAIVQARVARVVYGAADDLWGAAGSVFDVLGSRVLNHRPECAGGLLADRSADLLRDFFKTKRRKDSN